MDVSVALGPAWWCTQCDHPSFPSQKALAGHIGGKHGDLSFGKKRRIDHGTNRGYQAHIRHAEPFDGCDCRSAHSAFMRSHRAMKRAWK